MAVCSNGRAVRGFAAYPAAPSAEMAAFDALPRTVRRRLAAMPINVAVGPLLDFWLTDTRDCIAREAAILSALDDACLAVGRAA